jgi:hypothetical protein
MTSSIDTHALQHIARELRDFTVSDARAPALAREVARVNDAARTEGARNGFNVQPTDFSVALAALAKK